MVGVRKARILLELAGATKFPYRIVLFCSADVHIFKYELNYDLKTGKLMQIENRRESIMP